MDDRALRSEETRDPFSGPGPGTTVCNTQYGKKHMTITIKRAHDKATKSDGYRVLVDRIWPRGISKEAAALDDWIKPLAPSTELRQWFGHDPARWDEFRNSYRKELLASDEAQEALANLRQRARKHHVTLVYAAKDTEHSNATFLKTLLEKP